MRYLLLNPSSPILTKSTLYKTKTHATTVTKRITIVPNRKRINSDNCTDTGITTSSTTVTGTCCNHNIVTKNVKKWGQQCGVSCNCVIRFEIDIDSSSGNVIMAEYTAKQIVTTTIPIVSISNSKSHSNSNDKDTNGIHKNNTNPIRTTQVTRYNRTTPVLTSRTQRLQYVPSNCIALHQLSMKTIQYFINRPLYQIINHHEFQFSRSSTAFRDTVLSIQNLQPKNIKNTNTNTTTTNNNNAFTNTNTSMSKQLLQPKTKQNTNHHHHRHCFDLVEDAITALLKGYVPPPRQPDHKKLLSVGNIDMYHNYNRISNLYDDDINDNDDNDYDYDEAQLYWSSPIGKKKEFIDTKLNKTSTIDSIPWQDRSLHLLLWWPFTLSTWTKTLSSSSSNNNNDDNTQPTYHVIPASGNSSYNNTITRLQHKMIQNKNTSSTNEHKVTQSVERQHWTALDWLDWFDNNRLKQEEQENTNLDIYHRFVQQQQQQEEKSSKYNSRGSNNNNNNNNNISDWLTYVDTMYNYDSRTNNQKSA